MRFPLLALLLVAAPLGAQTPDAVIPSDTAVRTGTLSNGLRYWIRQHPLPADRLELRLVVRAGSIQEDADQLGLAHFVEHMAFNGTTRFKKNDLVQYLESIGVRFGADLNASTSFDETIYILPVPTDKPELLERAFDILEDWATGVRFDSADVVGERGVVLGEWRSGLSADKRAQDKEFPLLFQGSRYADRLPIGDTAILARANPAPMQRFYRDWYRPDLMAVVAVGDVPVAKLEALIRDRFGKIPMPANPRPRVDAPIPEVPGTRVSIVTDPEFGGEQVELLVRRPSHGPYRTEQDERRALVNAIVSSIAGQRLSDIARRPETSFIGAGMGPMRLIRDVELFALSVTPKEGKLTQAFEEVLRESRRLAQHGVLAAELERTKTSLLRGREIAASEQEKQFSGSFVGQYVDAFINGNVTPSARTRYALAQRILPTITKAEIDAVLREQAAGHRPLPLGAHSREGLHSGADARGAARHRASHRHRHHHAVDRSHRGRARSCRRAEGRPDRRASAPSPTSASPSGRSPTACASSSSRPTSRPTRSSSPAWSPGGTSLVSDADVINAQLATIDGGDKRCRRASTRPSLRRRLAGKVARGVDASIDDLSEGISGSTTPKDLDTFFELLWLNATAPRYDSNAVAAFVNQMKNQLAGRDRIPTVALLDTLMAV